MKLKKVCEVEKFHVFQKNLEVKKDHEFLKSALILKKCLQIQKKDH